MPRSRSRSKERYDDRDRRRSRSRSRERRRDRDKYRSSRRSRSRSRDRRRPRDVERSRDVDRSRDMERSRDERRYEGSPYVSDEERETAPVSSKEITADELVSSVEDDEKKMMELMGFGTFDSTKGKKVEGNDHYVANIVRKRRYRQYMNRRGGFNRPLDFIA